MTDSSASGKSCGVVRCARVCSSSDSYAAPRAMSAARRTARSYMVNKYLSRADRVEGDEAWWCIRAQCIGACTRTLDCVSSSESAHSDTEGHSCVGDGGTPHAIANAWAIVATSSSSYGIARWAAQRVCAPPFNVFVKASTYCQMYTVRLDHFCDSHNHCGCTAWFGGVDGSELIAPLVGAPIAQSAAKHTRQHSLVC